MTYGIYNDELGYSNGAEFKNAFDAVIAAWNKCRRHSVIEYDDNGNFVRRLPDCEERAIYEVGAAAAPATKIEYIFPARTPLTDKNVFETNNAYIQPFKDLAKSRGIQFGGCGALIGVAYRSIQNKQTKVITPLGIAIFVDYGMPEEDRQQFDALAKEMHCPLVIEINKYHKEKSVKSYK